MEAVLPACRRARRHDHHQHGRGQPARPRPRGRRDRATARACRAVDRGRDRRRRARRGAPGTSSSRRPVSRCGARRSTRLRQRLHRRRADRRGARRRRRRRDHRPRRPIRRCSSRRWCTSSAGALDDWPPLGRGTLVGHLLECAGQVTGGYFADPGVQGCRRISTASGFPIAEVPAQGPIVITKLPGSGGRVTPATCKEQLLYEIHDPAAYVTPDVVADFSRVRVITSWRAIALRSTARRTAAAGHAEGLARLPRRLHRRRPDLVRGRRRRRARPAGRADCRGAARGARACRRRCAVRPDRRRARCTAAHLGRGRRPYEVRLRVAARAAIVADARRSATRSRRCTPTGPPAAAARRSRSREVLSVASTLHAALARPVHVQIGGGLT